MIRSPKQTPQRSVSADPGPIVEDRRRRLIYIEEVEDPVSGGQLVFEAASEEELDEQVARHFGIPEAEGRDRHESQAASRCSD